MTGVFADSGLTAGVAILIGLLLILAVFSGRMSPRAQNIIAGCALVVALVAAVWAAFASAARGDWFRVAFFVIILIAGGWRMWGAYRKRSVSLAGEAK